MFKKIGVFFIPSLISLPFIMEKVLECNEKFDESDKFEKVYDKEGIKIYVKSPSSH